MKTIRLLLFLVFLVPLPALLHAEEMGIVAVVNDEVITQAELDQALAPIVLQMQSSLSPEQIAAKMDEIREEILQQIIEERLLLQEARQPTAVEFGKNKIGTPNPISVSEEEIDKMVGQVTAKFKNISDFNEALHRQNLTIQDLRERYRKQITIKKLIGREIYTRISVSPAEVTSYYQQHENEFIMPAAVKAAVITIQPKAGLGQDQARSLAENLRRQVLGGADFYDLAARYSEGPNAKMGGRLGWVDQGKSLKEIDQVIFTLKPGDVSPVIQTTGGFHIFRVEEFRPAEQANLGSVKDLVRDRLYEKKGAALYKEWVDKLKEHAYISIK